MTNSASSSKILISQEVENPSSFNFSIPLPDESHSTPVCGVGEMDESITPLAEVVASPVLSSEENLPYSPTLNSEAQYVDESSAEEVEVASRGVSSTMSERFFEGDLPEGRGPESNILAVGAELVATQSLTLLRGNEEEEKPPLRWNRIGVRGSNTLTVGIPNLETANNTHESEKERQRNGKGNMVVSRSKGDKKRYGTRSETQKLMGSAIAASRVQTERARKRRRKVHEPKKPTSTHLPIMSSDTESNRIKEGEEKRVESKELQKAAKKSLVKKGKVKKGTTVKSSRAKGLGQSVQNPIAAKKMTREEQITEIEKQKVLNDRVFYHDIITDFGTRNLLKMDLLEDGGIKITVKGVKILLDEETLGIILGVLVEVVRSIKGCQPSSEFSTRATKRGDVKRPGLPKKFLKGEY
ncbi:hypothetical protein H5410_061907 [Solanum commersonii]|uniref:Uncharacterized protein n=1 Tax=Solanum commersonii TaxID=4109 RepID=A0A9J5W985_SOLCO|nr:hypothetical protein H5410_061907 [Solanum commersonii]